MVYAGSGRRAAGPVDPQDYRQAIGRFATGVSVVTTVAAAGPRGITVNSLTSVSLDPVLVLFCVEHVARFHADVMASGEWGVSVLRAEQEELSRLFATRGRPDDDEHFATVAHQRGARTGVPLLDGALATLECRTVSTHEAGDHTVVLGEVLSVATASVGEPLLYFEGRYRGLTGM